MSTYYLTRLVIETQSPLAINTGGRATGFDTQLARDANGLPYIPGTSIAGVWRALAKTQMIDECFWFGVTDKRSTLQISDGVVHDANNKPVTGLVSQKVIAQDPLLALLQQDRPHHRDRVRLNDRGVAADEAKFDQLLLPTGVRFCIDIQWLDDHIKAEDQQKRMAQWQELLDCWQHRLFALGATTRNGLGQIKVIASEQQRLELCGNVAAAASLCEFRQKRVIPTQLDQAFRPLATAAKPFVSMELQALDNWRCGSGTQLLGQYSGGHSIAMITYSEINIEWHDPAGSTPRATINMKPKPILCGSSIKGILAHRVAFHLRRLSGEWAHTMADCDHQQWQTDPPALKALFGYADETDHNASFAGRLYVDDCAVEYEHTVIRQHTNIDRFTGGVRHGALFNEELLYQPKFKLNMWLAPNTEVSEQLKQALFASLDDLKNGLLPLGAGSGRGTSLVSLVPDSICHIEQQQIAILSPSDTGAVA